MIRTSVVASIVAITLASPARAQDTNIFISIWNPAVQLTAERSDRSVTADIAGNAWVSADWVSEPAPAYGPGAFYLKNAWRNTYLTYIHEMTNEFDSNAALLPKIINPADRRQQVRADGQAWVFEPVNLPGMNIPGIGRLKPAHRGFGLTYLSMSRSLTGSAQQAGEGVSVGNPMVHGNTPNQRGTFWMRAKSSKSDQQQCLRNMSGTVMDVDWYKGSDATLQMAGKDELAIIPPARKPDLTERKSLGFESCETSNQRMVAAVRLVGKDQVTNVLAPAIVLAAGSTGLVFGGAVGAAAGVVGGTKLAMYLNDQPTTVYIGVPGKADVEGTLYNAKVKPTTAIKY